MRIPKRYGQSRIDRCPFCGKHATTSNEQGVPVCKDHKNSELKDLKCVCGEYLDVRSGKFGTYFHCMNCGNMNMKKALEINDVRDKSIKEESDKKTETYKKYVKKEKEITIRSDDPDYF
jgi:hypothetical protein